MSDLKINFFLMQKGLFVKTDFNLINKNNLSIPNRCKFLQRSGLVSDGPRQEGSPVVVLQLIWRGP